MTASVLGEWALFLSLSAVALAGAALMLITMSMYRAGLFLMVSFVALGGLFFLLHADLLAAIQIMMNVGGMLVMILFMVMLMMDPGGEMMWDMKRQMKLPGIGAFSMSMPRGTRPHATRATSDSSEAAMSDHPPAAMNGMDAEAHRTMMVSMAMSTEQLPWALAIGLALALMLAALVMWTPWQVAPTVVPVTDGATAVGTLLLSRYMMVFEGAAMLILAGIAGAVILGRRETSVPVTPAIPVHSGDTDTNSSQPTHHPEEMIMDSASKSGSQSGNVYTCPMHPEVRSDKPGKCPKCGMDLVKAGGSAQQGGDRPSGGAR